MGVSVGAGMVNEENKCVGGGRSGRGEDKK